MKWILNQYAKLIIEFSKDKIKVTDIERLDFKSDSLINNYYNDSVIIVEDEYNNCFEMARQIDSRIKRNGMVHVITCLLYTSINRGCWSGSSYITASV